MSPHPAGTPPLTHPRTHTESKGQCSVTMIQTHLWSFLFKLLYPCKCTTGLPLSRLQSRPVSFWDTVDNGR